MSANTSGRLWIHGLGRSGTTWMLKIFDHHPGTFCSHEPELTMRQPGNPEEAPAPALLGPHLDAMFRGRPLRAMRPRPIMTKAYRSAPAHAVRKGLIYGMALAAKPFGRRCDRWPVPDLCGPSELVAVKSVGHQPFLAEMIANPAAAAGLKILYLVRHPCGNILSNLRGVEAGKMVVPVLPQPWLMRAALGDDLAAEVAGADLDRLEIFAWRWRIINGLMARLAEGQPHVRVLSYEDLCDDPLGVARGLFEWTGLDWDARVEGFLKASLAATGDAAGYHDTTRNPAVAARKWQGEMDPADIDRVLEICRESPAFALYPDG